MRIACPFCSAAYDVPESLLREARMVRCAQCLREWSVGPVAGEPVRAVADRRPPAEPPASKGSPGPEGAKTGSVGTATLLGVAPPAIAIPQAAGEPRPTPLYPPDPAIYYQMSVGSPVVEPEMQKPRAPVWAAWAASIAVLLLLGWAAYTWRTEVMEAWPPSQRLYAALGLRSTTE